MTTIIDLNTPVAKKVCSTILRTDLIGWLNEYVGDDNFIIHYRINTLGTYDDKLVEFLNEDDAMQFRIKFGL